MFSTESISILLKKLESRLEDCMRCGSCLAGIMAALEFTVAEASGLRTGLAEGDSRGMAATARDFAISGSLKALKPWEKIHV
ncbi:MAG: hypothetical protein HY790_14290 [Deltaproteobacteria bacterium]|nr:hypothetical protein [Deltaproteobacteria bacterium]MBI4796983.1 hypothetical protein [Deltaproteobacteria bacterium]